MTTNTSGPRIAIPEPTSNDQAYNDRSLPQYTRAVEAAGGTAVVIPLREPVETQAALLLTCSGVLLPGSPADVDPHRYGQEPLPATAAKDAAREATDDLLLADVFRSGKPMLGVCFGLQSLNVWRTGSLIQDLPKAEEAAEGRVNHQPGREVLEAHPVTVVPGSRLSRLLSETSEKPTEPLVLRVNSSHHQAIDRPGSMLRIAARSPEDGVIEALEAADQETFVFAVQWHPERSYEQSAASRTLFASLVKAAEAWTSSVNS